MKKGIYFVLSFILMTAALSGCSHVDSAVSESDHSILESSKSETTDTQSSQQEDISSSSVDEGENLISAGEKALLQAGEVYHISSDNAEYSIEIQSVGDERKEVYIDGTLFADSEAFYDLYVEELFGKDNGWFLFSVSNTDTSTDYPQMNIYGSLEGSATNSVLGYFWDSRQNACYEEYGTLDLVVPRTRLTSDGPTLEMTDDNLTVLYIENDVGIWKVSAPNPIQAVSEAEETIVPQFGQLCMRELSGECVVSYMQQIRDKEDGVNDEITLYQEPKEEEAIGEISVNADFSVESVYYENIYYYSHEGVWKNDGTWIYLTADDGTTSGWAKAYQVAREPDEMIQDSE